MREYIVPLMLLVTPLTLVLAEPDKVTEKRVYTTANSWTYDPTRIIHSA